MTIKEIIDTLETMEEEQRALVCMALASKYLCRASRMTLQEFQATWDGSKTFHEYRAAQDQVFLNCLEAETSELGTIVRKALGLDTEVLY